MQANRSAFEDHLLMVGAFLLAMAQLTIIVGRARARVDNESCRAGAHARDRRAARDRRHAACDHGRWCRPKDC